LNRTSPAVGGWADGSGDLEAAFKFGPNPPIETKTTPTPTTSSATSSPATSQPILTKAELAGVIAGVIVGVVLLVCLAALAGRALFTPVSRPLPKLAHAPSLPELAHAPSLPKLAHALSLPALLVGPASPVPSREKSYSSTVTSASPSIISPGPSRASGRPRGAGPAAEDGGE
jgi:hypothetical protein